VLGGVLFVVVVGVLFVVGGGGVLFVVVVVVGVLFVGGGVLFVLVCYLGEELKHWDSGQDKKKNKPPVASSPDVPSLPPILVSIRVIQTLLTILLAHEPCNGSNTPLRGFGVDPSELRFMSSSTL